MERGVVKWFNEVSDYGFITCDEGGPDRYVRGAQITGGSSTLRAGSRVEFEVREGGMGPEAIGVHVHRQTAIRRRSSGSFDPSHRHGAFDPRFRRSPAHMVPRPPGESPSSSEGGVGWYAFLTESYPGRQRHDLEALKAFEAYRNGLGRTPVLPAPAGVGDWEGEGGATR